MPANKFIKMIGFAGMIFLFTFCGQRGVPTGGPKDETSPKIVKSYPQNFSPGFKGTKVVLKFDEFIQVKAFNNEFIISPPIKNPPKYRLSGKKLTIEFDSTLAENTTYSMFFGKAIVDLNEGNVLDSNTFVFATGAQLDSLELNGKVVDASTGAPLIGTGVTVHLYKNLNDSAPIKLFPSYFAAVKDGKFNFNSLAAGEYKLFVLEDANRNYRYDLPNEKIAFLSQNISIPADTSELILRLFSPEKTQQKVFKPSSPSSGKVLLSFNKSVKDFSINYLGFSPHPDSVYQLWSKTQDTLQIFSSQFMNLDSLKFRVRVDGLIDDTLKINFKKKKTNFAPKASYSATEPNNFNQPLNFDFSIPLANYMLSGIKIIQDKDTVIPNSAELSANKMNLKIKHQFLPEKAYRIIIFPKTFKSVLNQQNDTIKYFFTMAKAEDFGTLLIKYNLPQGSYIMQLIKNESIVLEQVLSKSSGEISYKNLAPGEHKLIFIEDKNGDGKWTTGNYFEKRQPETSILYEKPVLIRANWDLEIVAP